MDRPPLSIATFERLDSDTLDALANVHRAALESIEEARRRAESRARHAAWLKRHLAALRASQRAKAGIRAADALRLARRGLTNAEIGARLGCSTRTVTRLLGRALPDPNPVRYRT